MNKIGAAVLFGLIAYVAPVSAAEVSARAASQTETDDVTGAINREVTPRSDVSGGAAANSSASYQQAFRSWRDCVATHQGVGNPPPACEPLRIDLRRAMSERPRNEASK